MQELPDRLKWLAVSQERQVEVEEQVRQPLRKELQEVHRELFRM